MRYMLLIYLDEKSLDEAEREACYRESTDLAEQIAAAGQYLASAPLHPTSMAASVRIRSGKRLVTDGPFAETHEQLGGYFLIDAKDLDEAIAIAARIPMARRGTVEVRPVIELPDLPPAPLPAPGPPDGERSPQAVEPGARTPGRPCARPAPRALSDQIGDETC
jgi:hypothetical protein